MKPVSKHNCIKFFSDDGFEDPFFPIRYSVNSEVDIWILKAEYELKRYISYLLLLDNKQKDDHDSSVCFSLHESLASCSTAIVFSLFNIFSLLTKTEATFFDESISDYFSGKNLTREQSVLLSFSWHLPVQEINSLVFDPTARLEISKKDSQVVFRVSNPDVKKIPFTGSVCFFAGHLTLILNSASLLSLLLSGTYIFQSHHRKNSGLIKLENMSELIRIMNNCIRREGK